MSHYVLRATNTAVELWSGYRLQFQDQERHLWQREAKAELKAALAALVATPGSAFSGYYDTTDPRPNDTENSLFTNTREVLPSGVRFLSFEQGASRPPAPPTPIDLIQGHLHYYRYKTNCEWTIWKADRTLARWNRVPRRLPGDDSARPTWFALRDAGNTGRIQLIGEKVKPESDFGIKVIVHATRRGPFDAIANSEPIIDGIIAAFHNDGLSDDVVAGLALRLPKVSPDDIRRALETPIGPLFETPAITCSPDGFVQISPSDERCRIGELVICNDSTSQWPELSGELFTIRPATVL